jgi:FtsZ-interacting cell division protein ZipA
MSSREFAEWIAYEQVTGTLGPERGDMQAALVAAVMHGLWSKKRRKLKDFLFRWDRGRKMTTEEMLAQVRALNRLVGGEEVVRER